MVDNITIMTMAIEHADYPICCDMLLCDAKAKHFTTSTKASFFMCDKHWHVWQSVALKSSYPIVYAAPIGIHFTPIDTEPTNP